MVAPKGNTKDTLGFGWFMIAAQIVAIPALFLLFLQILTAHNQVHALSDKSEALSQLELSSMSPASNPVGSRYILKVKLSQSRFSLDPFEHLSDAMNAETFEIFTDKQAYDSAKIGSPLFEAFRTGSFFIKGSWSSWNLKVIEKRIIKE